MTALFNAPLVKTWAFAAAALMMAALPARAEIEIQEVTTPGGISAWLVEEPSIPFVALELRFKGGGSLDAPGKRGATNLMVGLLEEGTGEMDARAFARELESLAASFDYDTFDDTISVSAKFLTDTTDAPWRCCAARWWRRRSTRWPSTGSRRRCCPGWPRTCPIPTRSPAAPSTGWRLAITPMPPRLMAPATA